MPKNHEPQTATSTLRVTGDLLEAPGRDNLRPPDFLKPLAQLLAGLGHIPPIMVKLLLFPAQPVRLLPVVDPRPFELNCQKADPHFPVKVNFFSRPLKYAADLPEGRDHQPSKLTTLVKATPSRAFFAPFTGIVIAAFAALAAGDDVALRFTDPAGRVVEPLAARGQKVTVLFFLTTECPIGNRYAPEISRIVRDYQARGVTCHAVYAHETAAEVAAHLREFQFPLPAVLDPELKLAERTGATTMPEACVLSPAGEILYRGRIDDRAVKLGTVRLEPRVRDLRLALDAVLAGKPVAEKYTQAIGCYISPPSSSD